MAGGDVVVLLPLSLHDSVGDQAENRDHSVEEEALDLLQVLFVDLYTSLSISARTLLQVHRRQHSPTNHPRTPSPTRRGWTPRTPGMISA